MHWPDLRGVVGGTTVVETAQQDDCISLGQFCTDEFVSVRRPLVTPEMGARDYLGSSIFNGGGTCWHHETDENVVAHDVSVGFDMCSMVVFVVSVDTLCLAARANSHCHRHGEQRVGRVRCRLVVVVISSCPGQKVFADLLIQRVAKELFPDRFGPGN